MEKLINLLNECNKSQLNEFEDYEDRWYCKWNWKILKGNWENDNELNPYELCSKQYWFTDWLVDKDKINRPKFFDAVSDYCEDLVPYPAYETLPMLLAISNSPVEDLILYLK